MYGVGQTSGKRETDMNKIRWGILGAGKILDRWMKGARQHDDMEIAAIASRTEESAQKAAEKYQIPAAMTYEALLERPDIDVVYIPVPHTAHMELAIRAMAAKKAVLVEKPAGINAGQWEKMTASARENQVFLMEAVWTRFFPVLKDIEELLPLIGEVRVVSTNFSFRSEDMSSRLMDPKRAGGSLLDVGVYDLHFTRMILKKDPVLLRGVSSVNTDEHHLMIDEQAAWIAQYDKGELGLMCSAVRTDMEDTAYIYGTKGYLKIPHFWKPERVECHIGQEEKVIERPVPQKIAGVRDEGYQFEIAHVNDCLRKGLKTSPVMPWQESAAILSQCDSLRKQWGLIYPGE